MKTLESIQKTCKVFQNFAKIAMILSFIWAGTILVGLLCGIAWRTGGSLIGVSVENALELTQAAGLEQMIGALLADFVFALTDCIVTDIVKVDTNSICSMIRTRKNNCPQKRIVLLKMSLTRGTVYPMVIHDKELRWMKGDFKCWH